MRSDNSVEVEVQVELEILLVKGTVSSVAVIEVVVVSMVIIARGLDQLALRWGTWDECVDVGIA